jgi:hypothetical protein
VVVVLSAARAVQVVIRAPAVTVVVETVPGEPAVEAEFAPAEVVAAAVLG